VFNLLDTPGHADFSEDTYRTLSAVDAAVMVIDAAKGIENQTRKLFEVCRLRDIPIVTFINKVDREGQDALAAARRDRGGLGTRRGADDVAGRHGRRVPGLPRRAGQAHAAARAPSATAPSTAPEPLELEDILSMPGVDGDIAARALEGLELARMALPEFDLSVVPGRGTSRRCSSAARCAISACRSCSTDWPPWAPGPRPRKAAERVVQPDEKAVTGFVFKVQANMDPNHRDRVAFMRLCSGRFRRGMKMLHVREGRTIAVASPILFFAQQRETADEAYAGDIIGLPNHGTMRVGDTVQRGRGPEIPGHSQLRAGAAAPRPDRGRHEGQAAQPCPARSGRGRRGAGIPAGVGFAHHSGRGGRAAVRRAAVAPATGVWRAGALRGGAVRGRALGAG
jgi:peptide chain release factor 3